MKLAGQRLPDLHEQEGNVHDLSGLMLCRSGFQDHSFVTNI